MARLRRESRERSDGLIKDYESHVYYVTRVTHVETLARSMQGLLYYCIRILRQTMGYRDVGSMRNLLPTVAVIISI